MDASVALMNQYTAIATRFPPAAQPQVPAESAPAGEPSEVKSAPSTSSSHSNEEPPSKAAAPEVEAAQPEATTSGVEKVVDSVPGSSQNASANVIDENEVTIEDLGRDDDDQGSSDQASELRRRRLQKFLNVEQNKE